MKLIVLLLLQFSLSFATELYPLHSHNDQQQRHALTDAYQNHFQSIEVDTWPGVNGKIVIGHFPWEDKGYLEKNYLTPLQNLMAEEGCRYSATRPLLLWIDIKWPFDHFLPMLAKALRPYPMIGQEVQVILTGMKTKYKFSKRYPDIPVEVDFDELTENSLSDPGFTWYSLDWKKMFKWRGDKPIPQDEYLKLVSVLKRAHSAGKKVRFYNNPDNKMFWSLLRGLQVDLLGTDKITDLRIFWESAH